MTTTTFSKNGLLALLFALPMLFCSSCINYEDVEMLGVQDFKVRELSPSNILVEVYVKVRNPNNYNISVVGSDLQLELNGDPMGKAKIKNNIIIPKNSTETHMILVQADPTKLAENPLGMAMSLMGKPLNVGVKGKVKARARFISKKFDVDITERVSL